MFFTNYGVKFMPATENTLKKKKTKKQNIVFLYDLEQFRLHANVASLEDLIDQPTITQIVLHVPVIQALKVTFSLKSTKNSSGLCYARCRGETLEVVKVGPQQKDGLQYKAIMSKPQNVEHTMYFIGIQNKKKKNN